MPSPPPLVDTHVISELSRPRPNEGVLAWAQTVSQIALSVVAVEELAFGLAWRPNERIRAWMERFLDERCEVLPVTLEIARRSADMRGRAAARGRVHTQADTLIAATAELHQRTLVTRNVRDFRHLGIALLNPFA